jgi:prepilin-type N-terminal cleavage/methylation domain-containing protein
VTRRRPRAGFTLVELLIVVTMLSVVMLATARVILVVQRDFVAQRGIAAAEDRVQTAEETIVRVLRGGRADPYAQSVGLINPNPLAHGSWDNIRVTSDFNPADRDVADPLEDVALFVRNDSMFVRWQAGAAAQAVAYPVRSVLFEYYQLDGTRVTATPIDSTVKRVKYDLTVPRTVGSSTLVRRQGWVFLRN